MPKLIFVLCGLSLVLLESVVAHGSSGKCEEGPNYWCRNDVTAKQCGAINFCIFEKQSSTKGNKKVIFEETTQKIQSSLTAPPVNVTLYYESLCPECKEILTHQIKPTFDKLKSTGILNIDLVPYGNAQERAYGNQWIYYCQHGANECAGNLIETCFIKHYPDQKQYMPFIFCVEYYGPTATNGRYCAGSQQLDYTVVDSCASGSEGNAYEHEMALKTNALNPPHQYVPWFTMNGYHSNTIQQQLSSNMLAYVCSAYTGTKPSECSGRKRYGASYKEQ